MVDKLLRSHVASDQIHLVLAADDLEGAVLAVENTLLLLGLGQAVSAGFELGPRMEQDLAVEDVLHDRKIFQVHHGSLSFELVDARVPDVDGNIVVRFAGQVQSGLQNDWVCDVVEVSHFLRCLIELIVHVVLAVDAALDLVALMPIDEERRNMDSNIRPIAHHDLVLDVLPAHIVDDDGD